MSNRLVDELRLGLDSLDEICEHMAPLLELTPADDTDAIHAAAASAMLHSVYTEVEKMLKRIALECDGHMPDAAAWHKELLNQIAQSTPTRPAVFSLPLVESLSEYLAFRHLFRGASVVLMRWNKLAPLVANVPGVQKAVHNEIEAFIAFLESRETTN